MFLYKKSKIESRKVNILFAPGLPGKMMDRQIFDDLSDLGCDIFSFYYPGTYNETGSFDLDIATLELIKALEQMDNKREPFIIIGYSFSSLLLQKIDLSNYQNILSLAFFSPIMGLDTDSINADFYKELEDLQNIQENGFCCNFEKLSEQIKTSGLDFKKSLFKLNGYKFPVTFAYSLNDSVIKVEIMDEILRNYRAKNNYNAFLVWNFDNGYHGLDSYYNKNISAYFEGLLISNDIRNLIISKVYIYFWGSQITKKSNQDSDIDLLIFTESNHLEYTQKLREYQEEYSKIAKHKFDLSINNLNDTYKIKSYRFNRGASITHELHYHYFPIFKIPFIPIVQIYELLEDSYQATLTNLNEARKILLKTSLTSDRIRKIPKYTIFALIYLQYFYSNYNLDWSNIKNYYENNSKYNKMIKRIEQVQSNNYKDISLEFLQECVQNLEDVHEEQESILSSLKNNNPRFDKEIESFYIMRHAEKSPQTSHNSLVNANLDITEEGKLKTKAIAEYLSNNTINAVYSSQYVRAISTAKIVAEVLKTTPKQEKLVHEKIFANVDLSDQEALDLFNKTFEDWNFQNHGSESLNESISRLKKGIQNILAQEDYSKVLIVSHGRVMQSFFNKLLNYSQKDFSLQSLVIDYCEVYQIFYKSKDSEIDFLSVSQVL